MKYTVFLIAGIIYTVSVLGQDKYQHKDKPVIDFNSIERWKTVENPGITNDGEYIKYVVDNFPQGSRTLVVKSTDKKWDINLLNIVDGVFSGDNKQFIFISVDTLCFLKLGSDKLNYVLGISSYKRPIKGQDEWLAYKEKSSYNTLVLKNLFDQSEMKFDSVTDYSFDEKGNSLFIKTETRQDKSIATLKYINLSTKQVKTIWTARSNLGNEVTIGSYCFDAPGFQLAFVQSERTESMKKTSIWYYNINMDKATIMIEDNDPQIDSDLVINNYLKFSKNGSWLFFQLKEANKNVQTENGAMVDIWNYKDKILQSIQLKDFVLKTYAAALDIKNNRMIRLEHENEHANTEANGDYVVINNNDFGSQLYVDSWWDSSYPKSYYLFFLKSNLKVLLTNAEAPLFSFSPGGRYVVYFDRKKRAYFSYDTQKYKRKNITSRIPALLSFNNLDKLYKGDPNAVGVAGWLINDSALMIYDNYDIWKVDPQGIKKPTSITNGYGQLNHIKFKIVFKERIITLVGDTTLLLLNAFNVVNKYNGFYQKKFNEVGDPKLLVMAPYSFYRTQKTGTGTLIALNQPISPIKAANSEKWIVQRMSASEAPNYFITEDFKNYTALTNVHPETEVNWLTAEILNWRGFDGVKLQGILYKPENFNPKIKYPIIFNYYERLTDRLFDFPQPKFIGQDINIPWFVSRGYLVFTPDIHYTIGFPGRSALNSVVSAAKYLSRLPFIDAKRMGIQGHSFGGFETNYIITHTNLFAAAAEGAGQSDFISGYGSISGINGLGMSRQSIYETGQSRIGATIWEKPYLYICNSPIFKADQVKTPLLMMHNKNDENVPWAQGVEFFTALRRLGKKVWMLQYDGDDHVIRSKKNSMDYTIRVTQFFDYYLRNLSLPKWMARGIPARLKGIDTGLKLEN